MARGRLDKGVEEVLGKLKGILEDFEAEFYLINDISNFKLVYQETVQFIEESVVGKMQVERTDEEDYYVATASSREEAEEPFEDF